MVKYKIIGFVCQLNIDNFLTPCGLCRRESSLFDALWSLPQGIHRCFLVNIKYK